MKKTVICLLLGALSTSASAINDIIYKSDSFSVHSDRVIQGKYSARALSATEIMSDYPQPNGSITSQSIWKLAKDVTSYPQYSSDQVLVDALYNMALEETSKDIEADGTFRTGKLWDGVWTRDISYSIFLSQALINPEVCKTSLMRKVQNGRIIQDTGTGGSWPVSTDRIVWAFAANELYNVTGDKTWLKEAYQIIRNSAIDDQWVAKNPRTGLMYGESSFLDWREQEYPLWMEPIDIYKSQCLGTNALHYQLYRILEQMGAKLKEPVEEYKIKADEFKNAINKYLWIEDKGYYAQFMYGKNFYIKSPRCETLGEALAVLFDIADSQRQTRIIENTVVTSYGIPCFSPQIPGIPPYHNNAIWPFVQAYWNLASAKTGNEQNLVKGIASVYRPAALLLTNWENMVAESGTIKGTQVNSPVMMWSISGNLAMVYRVYCGMNFQADGISFTPFVPETLQGHKELSNIKYRNSLLDIVVNGYGNKIKSFILDEKKQTDAFFPATLTGKHSIIIELNNESPASQKINLQKVEFSLPTPKLSWKNDSLYIDCKGQAKKYILYKNGSKVKELEPAKAIYLPRTDFYAEYMLTAVDAQGHESFSDTPVVLIQSNKEQIIEAELYSAQANYLFTGYSGKGFVEFTTEKNVDFSFRVKIVKEGDYFIDFRYANGEGPINTENKCAIRTLQFKDTLHQSIIFPQRGVNAWNEWGYSNGIKVHLTSGNHLFHLKFVRPFNENMNVKTNRFMLDAIRVRQFK